MGFLLFVGLILLAQYIVAPRWFWKTYRHEHQHVDVMDDVSELHFTNLKQYELHTNILAFKHDYIRSFEWKIKREECFIRDDYRCKICGATEKIECHHKTYINLGEEKIKDLVTVCRECHQHIHDEFGYPDYTDMSKIYWNTK